MFHCQNRKLKLHDTNFMAYGIWRFNATFTRALQLMGFCTWQGASPRVADGAVGLQIWRLATNILNKQSWRADQEWYSSLYCKIIFVEKHHTDLGTRLEKSCECRIQPQGSIRHRVSLYILVQYKSD